MFNAEIPARAELPSSARLIKSTLLAAACAAVILITVVLPAEYAIDPTGAGRVLGLTRMGDIKKQLAIEAEEDRQQAPAPDRRTSILTRFAGLIVSPASAHPGHDEDADSVAKPLAQPAATRADEVIFTLKPNQGVEYKMTMVRGAAVKYSWRVTGGTVNYDMHGSPKGGGKESSYRKGRDTAQDEGTLTAAYDGTHGWFWRNRGAAEVTVALKVNGDYSAIKRMN
jgi:hypothetical protein